MGSTKKRRRRRKRYHTGTHVSVKSGVECKYRSGWEHAYMTYLDSRPDVASYSYESVGIPYCSNARSGRMRTYYPDLLVTHVDGTKQLVEIKPLRKLGQGVVVKKLAAARAWCEENNAMFVVVTEVELKALGII